MILCWRTVVRRLELASVRSAGPLSSIESNMDWTVSDIAENGTISSLRSAFIKWQAARDEDTEVTIRDALCHADTQNGRRLGCFEHF
jgi:hypothetical protein